jgi:hypothetical protein
MISEQPERIGDYYQKQRIWTSIRKMESRIGRAMRKQSGTRKNGTWKAGTGMGRGGKTVYGRIPPGRQGG